VFYDTLIWELSLDDNLQKRGLASHSEFANLQAGVVGSSPIISTVSHRPTAGPGCTGTTQRSEAH
jgi:hypothetical protein